MQRRNSKRSLNIPPLIRRTSVIHSMDAIRRSSGALIGINPPSGVSLQHRPSMSIMSSLYRGRRPSLSASESGGSVDRRAINPRRSALNGHNSSLLSHQSHLTTTRAISEGVELSAVREDPIRRAGHVVTVSGKYHPDPGASMSEIATGQLSKNTTNPEPNMSAPVAINVIGGEALVRSTSNSVFNPPSNMQQSKNDNCTFGSSQILCSPRASDRSSRQKNGSTQEDVSSNSNGKDLVIDIPTQDAQTSDEVGSGKPLDEPKRRSTRVFPIRRVVGSSENEVNIKLLGSRSPKSDDGVDEDPKDHAAKKLQSFAT